MTGGHAFVRPGQVAPDLPAPDNCMVCGQSRAQHESRPRTDGDIGGASFVACDGSGILTPADVQTMMSALRDAAENAVSCPDCDATPEDPCETCAERLRVADEYDALASKLGGDR